MRKRMKTIVSADHHIHRKVEPKRPQKFRRRALHALGRHGHENAIVANPPN